MAAAFGLLGGLGLFLVWWSCWERELRQRSRLHRGRIEQLIRRAGVERVTPAGLVASSVGLGLFVVLAFFVATGAWPVALCFGMFAGWLPTTLLRWQASRRAAVLRELWPD